VTESKRVTKRRVPRARGVSIGGNPDPFEAENRKGADHEKPPPPRHASAFSIRRERLDWGQQCSNPVKKPC
jgi:hypothetical protein